MPSRGAEAWARLQARVDVARFLLEVGGTAGPLTLARWIVRREYHVLTLALHQPPPPAPDLPGVRVAPLAEPDLPALRDLHPSMLAREVRRRWADGQHCVVGWVGAEPAHFHWASLGPARLPYLGLTLRPRRGESVMVEMRTHPGFRRHGVALACMQTVMRWAWDHGYRRTVYLMATWNREALRWRPRLGHTTAHGTVGFWNLGVTRHYFATGDVVLAPPEFSLPPDGPGPPGAPPGPGVTRT